MRVKKMTKDYEPVIVKSFWRKHTEEELNSMPDEQIMQLIDSHVEAFMDSWQKRNKGKDFPDLAKGTIADVRNKRTNISKAPRIIKS
jgi:hypothetical protein